MNAIRLSQIRFQYPGSDKTILDIESLEILSGDKVFLHGPSGSGKSTLLEILAGILPVQHGQMEILGSPLHTYETSTKDRFRSDHIGYIFQSFNLLPYLNVLENILLPLSFSPTRKNKTPDPEARARELCDKLGILALIEQPVHQLSIGQQQRVAAARSLIGSPEILLADEPTSALDFDHRERFLKLLFEVTSEQKTSVIFVSHDHSLKHLFDRHVSLIEINRASQRSTQKV